MHCLAVPQVTHFQLQKQREFEERAAAEAAAERDMMARRELSAEQYARQVGAGAVCTVG